MEESVKEPEEGIINKIKGMKWKQPGRLDVSLVFIYLFAWYLFNDMFNLISIEGLSSAGNFFNGINILASIPLFLSFIAMISVSMTFVIRSTFDTDSHRVLNTFMGIWIFFGTLLMVVALVLMLQGFISSYEVSWLLNLTRNSIYHIGLFVFHIPGIFYFALFK